LPRVLESSHSHEHEAHGQRAEKCVAERVEGTQELVVESGEISLDGDLLRLSLQVVEDKINLACTAD